MVKKCCYYIGLYIGLGPDANSGDSALQNTKTKERLMEQRGRNVCLKRLQCGREDPMWSISGRVEVHR